MERLPSLQVPPVSVRRRPMGRMGDGGGMTTPLPAVYTPDTVAAHLGVSGRERRRDRGTPQTQAVRETFAVIWRMG